MPAGRPKAVKESKFDNGLSMAKVESLAKIGATQEEIALSLGCDVRTVQRYMADKDSEFCQVYNKNFNEFKISLRRKQVKLAESNPAMLIWLGKNVLGQTDKIESKQDIELNQKVSGINIIFDK